MVVPSRCASCGICVGACDYNAINLPYMTEDDLKKKIRELSKALVKRANGNTVFVFVCAKGPFIADRLKDMERAALMVLPCIGMVQHSCLPIPLEEGVSGVVVAGCRINDCEYRRGNDWFEGRLRGVHPPVVRRTVDRSRVMTMYCSSVEGRSALSEIEAFRQGLKKGPS
ncbi:MAG: hydrogenase iron-sulfur subunit [Deltaproteobacteria bacterium]|nr:hydrogenase iron-sulfur subunit [Deltaproteobacteria bacterium]